MSEHPIVLAFGRRSCGKTYLARQIARHQARVVVWDLLGYEYEPMANLYDGDLDGFGRFLDWSRGRTFAAARYVPAEDVAGEFDGFCRALWSAGDFLVVVEEAAEVCQASYLPAAFGRVIRQGRHNGLGVLATTQRIAEVSRTLTALADVFVGFSTAEPRDLSALQERTTAEYVEHVKVLPPHQWLAWDVANREEHADLDRLLALWGAPAVWPHRVPA